MGCSSIGVSDRIRLTINVVIVIACSFAWRDLALAQQPGKIEDLFTERALDCRDIAVNCSRLIPEFYHRGRIDSVQMMLDYWQDHCPGWEPMTRMKILLAISQNRLNQMTIDEDVIFDLAIYRNQIMAGPTSKVKRQSLINPTFDSLAISLAKQSIAVTDTATAERLLCRFYAGDVNDFFREVQSPAYQSTALRRSYDEYARDVRNAGERYVGLIGGGWFPVGKRDYLGSHPVVGLSTGLKTHRFVFELGMAFAFQDSPRPYIYIKDARADTTTNFSLGEFELGFGYELCRSLRHELQVQFSLGAQIFNVVESEDEDKRRQISSMIASFGPVYRYYLGDYSLSFIAIQPRVEFSKMDTNGGSDLSGAALAVRVMLAFGYNDWKSDVLESLQYQY